MLLRLFLLFTLIPVAELAILIRLGGWLGLGPTLLLVLGTGAAGAWLARREGFRSFRAIQEELAAGRMPGEEMVHGVLILVAGIVLLTPGILTDLAGIVLLIRPFRRVLIARLRDRFTAGIETGTTGFVSGPGTGVFWASRGFGTGPGARPVRPRGREIVVEPEDGGGIPRLEEEG